MTRPDAPTNPATDTGDRAPAAANPPPDGEASTPLARALGIGDDAVETMGRLFGELTASLGIDGGPIFARLIAGQSIGQALAMPEGVTEIIYARAHSWFALGRVDRAEPLFRALCLLDDEDADFWVGYGVCLRMSGQLERAEQALQSAANLRPDWAVPHFHLLELALLRRQWRQARTALDAYDARSGADGPPRIASEVDKLRTALELALDSAGAPQPAGTVRP